MPKHTILTSYYCAPIPQRQFDWTAVLDGYDGAEDAVLKYNCCGNGATELEAIQDLFNRLELLGE